ncbi:retinol dehydrogenase 12 [Pholiota conissans]|uniref:Retinol dehydrogenase 12 n=1 Tax=Pholiota conissans TaxID=109636 RepID=A0A9P5ZCG1_9AGAR|nr:retinol dehydrogenase 12 [Pholiota conissans]
MKLSFWKFAWGQLTATVPPVVEENLDGNTVIVTGANSGLGFEAAKHFARMGAKLIIACRDKGRGEEALAKIKEATGSKKVELSILDLSKFSSVKEFVERFTKSEERLDILVANAAVTPAPKFEATEDGWEPTLQVNNIATSLLALELLPLMVETAKAHHTTPRVVVVSSEVHYWTKIPKEVVNSANPLRLFGTDKKYMAKKLGSRYEDSKLLNILFVRALNERLQHKSIIVNSPNPGYCHSNIRRNFTGVFLSAIISLMDALLARTSEEGSRQLVWAAIGHEDKKDELHGAYISLSQVTEPSDFVISEEGRIAQDKLWDNLIDELTKIDPKIQDIVKDYLKQ